MPIKQVHCHLGSKLEQSVFLRSLSAELTELRQAKESLDWLISPGGYLRATDLAGAYSVGRLSAAPDCPPYLKSRLEGKK